jgi:hypothetical protein
MPSNPIQTAVDMLAQGLAAVRKEKQEAETLAKAMRIECRKIELALRCLRGEERQAKKHASKERILQAVKAELVAVGSLAAGDLELRVRKRLRADGVTLSGFTKSWPAAIGELSTSATGELFHPQWNESANQRPAFSAASSSHGDRVVAGTRP